MQDCLILLENLYILLMERRIGKWKGLLQGMGN